ncbi:MAG: hypothetical protein PVI44_03990 [Balneolaceae bacterium]|jgi:hypothetical protein
MSNIKSHIEQILETGYEILFELEKEKPNLKKVQKLYDNRAASVNKLNDITTENINKLSKEDRIPLKNLFTRLQLLEKKLNKNLATLSEEIKESLQKLELHKKAKTLYTQASDQSGSNIVDLKSNS